MKLKTGFEFDANGSIVGIDDEGNIFEGYDGSLGTFWNEELDSYIPWPIEDRLALAQLMIERWTNYKDKVQAEK